jgi:hypothetical protein
MKTKNKNVAIKVWRDVAQDYARLIIPNRPSPQDCEIYGKLIKQAIGRIKGARILILGSTPEIRSILYTYTSLNGARVFCIDINSTMYQAMKNFIARADLKEKFIKKNWLATNFPNQYFDLVLGDEIICNIPKRLHQNLFIEISRILKNNHYFITRHNLFIHSRNTPQQIILSIIKKIDQGEISFQTAINHLYITLFYNKVQRTPENRVCMNEELEDIEHFYKVIKNKKYKKILGVLIKVFKENWGFVFGYYWYVLSKEVSEEELKKFFIIKKRIYANDYLTTKFSPIYSLKKK